MIDKNYKEPWEQAEEETKNSKGKKGKINKLKLYKKTLLKTLLAGAVVIGTVTFIGSSCDKNNDDKKEDNNLNNNNNLEDDEKINVIEKTEDITTAVINEDGTIGFNENSEEAIDRIEVTKEDIKQIVDEYYTYLNDRVEDSENTISIGELYSTVWMANSQFINVNETNEMIEENLIPSDLTTLKTETDNVMSLIISENASKVAVADAFGTELDINKLIEIDSLFVDEEDKEIANYSFNEYMKMISLSNSNKTFEIYENTRNFFNNTTKYDFNEIEKDAIHFHHDYPVNFTQTSIGAKYLIKGIMGPEFVVYTASKGSISQTEADKFQNTINDVEEPISYLNDKFNGICFDNEDIKTFVK